MTFQLKKEIEVGAATCKKIKEIYFPEKKWDTPLIFMCGEMLAKLKRSSRPFYPDLDELNFLRKLAEFGGQDIRDALDEK